MQVLIHYGRETSCWLANSPERRRRALKRLFQLLDEQGFYPDDLVGIDKARDGDIDAIQAILEDRKFNEWQDFSFVEATDP